MRVIATIDDPRVVRRILTHSGSRWYASVPTVRQEGMVATQDCATSTPGDDGSPPSGPACLPGHPASAASEAQDVAPCGGTPRGVNDSTHAERLGLRPITGDDDMNRRMGVAFVALLLGSLGPTPASAHVEKESLNSTGMMSGAGG